MEFILIYGFIVRVSRKSLFSGFYEIKINILN